MQIEQTGALLCRAVGLGFLVLAIVSLVHFWPLRETKSTGWTSYPATADRTGGESTIGTYSFVSSTFLQGAVAEFVAGTILIAFSRPIGRLLSRGLDNSEPTDRFPRP